jgi:hypothetical protein
MGEGPRKGRSRGVDAFLALPYLDRKFVVVVDDEIVRATRKLGKDLVAGSDEEWKRAFAEVAEATSPPSLIPRGLEVRAHYKKARDKHLDLFLLAQSEALQLDFPVGHPVHKVLYVGHPAAPRRYVAMGDFHRALFEHKVAETIRLLVGLGATDVEIEHVSGWTSTAEVGVNVAGLGGVETEHKKARGGRVMTKLILRPRREPHIPDDLVWYGGEPLWQAIAQARLDANLESFELDIKYTDDFSVNAKLSATVRGIGIEAGGTFTEHKETVWHLRGNFAEPRST